MELKKYLVNQKIEMEKYKWIKSQEAGKDLGEDAVKDWVKKYACQYRKEYNAAYNEIVHKTAAACHEKLKEKFPTVSNEIWEHFVQVVIDSFTENWTKEVVCCKDSNKKKHLEEI
jgi:hypothetical protein